jgi:hypothetical protein
MNLLLLFPIIYAQALPERFSSVEKTNWSYINASYRKFNESNYIEGLENIYEDHYNLLLPLYNFDFQKDIQISVCDEEKECNLENDNPYIYG